MRESESSSYKATTWRAALAGLCTLLCLTGCATDPVTGKSAFNLYTLDDDIKMGTQAMAQNVAQMQ